MFLHSGDGGSVACSRPRCWFWAVTLVATVVVAPETRWVETARHVMASALYVENWQLAADSTSYLKATNPPTPVQHYWSLSVEEQFYLVWPIMILLVTVLARRMNWRVGRSIAVSVAAVAASSFAYSVHETWTNPSVAYFSTPVRMWGWPLEACSRPLPLRRCGGTPDGPSGR